MYKNFFLYVGISSAAFTASAQKPNILLIVSDDQSAAHVGCYGNRDIKTPHIDSLASHGVIFNRAYCASPQSVPARASIFTGRSPVAVDMTRFNVTLDKEFKAAVELGLPVSIENETPGLKDKSKKCLNFRNQAQLGKSCTST